MRYIAILLVLAACLLIGDTGASLLISVGLIVAAVLLEVLT